MRRFGSSILVGIGLWGIGLRIAIDTGGTFTDCVAMVDGEMRVVKVRSTPGDPGAGGDGGGASVGGAAADGLGVEAWDYGGDECDAGAEGGSGGVCYYGGV